MTSRLVVFITALCLASLPAQAFLAIAESGELLPENGYQFGFLPQLQFNEGGGANVDAFLDAPFSDSTSFRAIAGAGTVDFHIGGSVKFIPFPDVDNQPAIGGKVAAWYLRDEGENRSILQFAPLVSRKFDTDHGLFIPYLALSLNFMNTKSRNLNGTQFVVGSEWRNPDWPDLLTGAELSLNLKDTYSALSVWVAFPFDGKRGFRVRR